VYTTPADKPTSSIPTRSGTSLGGVEYPTGPRYTDNPIRIPDAPEPAEPIRWLEDEAELDTAPFGSTTTDNRRQILILGAVVLMAAILFLGFRIATSAGSGGASSPEEAVEQMLAAVSDLDAVGFAEVFDPDELDAWFGSFTPAISRLNSSADTALRELGNDNVAELADGTTVSFTGPEAGPIPYEVEMLDDQERIAQVRITALDIAIESGSRDLAVITSTFDSLTALDLAKLDGTTVELRDAVRAGIGGVEITIAVPDEPVETEFAENFHLDLVTVDKDGKWYVSMGYSVLELAFNEAMAGPIYGRGFSLVDDQTGGAETPESVVQQVFDSIEELDYERIVDLSDPYATPYLHDWLPFLRQEISDQERRQAAADADIAFGDLTLGRASWEGQTVVTVDTVTFTAQGTRGVFDVASWCAISTNGTSDCAETWLQDVLTQLDSSLDASELIPSNTGFVVVERNGRWYLDALGTVGYLADQVAEVAAEVVDELDGNPYPDASEVLIATGPIARRDQPVTNGAQNGIAAVALDTSQYRAIESGSKQFNVALARLTTDQPARLLDEDVQLTGDDWLLTYDGSGADAELPAVAVSTAGNLEVELVDVAVITLDRAGFTGTFDDQGRPLIVAIEPGIAGQEITIEGANAETIYNFEDQGVVIYEPGAFAYIDTSEAFAVLTGKPGQAFTLVVGQPDLSPSLPVDPEPVYASFDEPDVNNFAAIVQPRGYGILEIQDGGFFDGCGGPDSPQARTWHFEDGFGADMAITKYESADQAAEQFLSLLDLQSPCDTYGVEIMKITQIDTKNILIEWQLIDQPDTLIYEHYLLDGALVLVAANETTSGLAVQLDILNS